MDAFWLVLFMAIIGALIGGITNAVAIRMLFRPHKARYIGKWRIPFTPGLIPKRKAELARQIGKIVDEHLLTPESIKQKITEPVFQKEIELVLRTESKKWIHSNITIAEMFERAQIEQPGQKIEAYLHKWIDNKYAVIKDFYVDQPVKESLPAEWLDRAEAKIPDIADYFLRKGANYFSSEEGRYRVKRMTNDFLSDWGRLGSMVRKVVGSTSLEEKIRLEIVKFLSSPGAKDLAGTMLKSEWERMIQWEWSQALEHFSDEKALQKTKSFVVSQLNVQNSLTKPLSAYLAPCETKLIDEMVPKLVERGLLRAAEHIPSLMHKLKIDGIVRSQIEAFSTERLERMVLEIAQRELRMITWLGALLGGLIGVLQALMMTMFSL
ncbi:DUF445 domain-containing protein [Domibacillus robiginosus]|uniref:DUF445 domain-containing protein n=1 Tax=Domibacillus robiginosus TaxID=1071054 RepID=UPI00067BE82B|nr:DUF445 family protein [Domibacillus robiginosus]